ncbi:hypothetical protein CLV62_12580 [Dysgonomonas alginatilytica]|uniref:Uncharacterized protein n=1 Tax=Dysgonomonas alginatilytica TaxID=1605892 RepID=A0A2V3PSA9_9BACT|nr:hypothetical protein [Dysgonomonas alginatilytica]PXV61247.1 hypothetical protein CLV62_12580 [Dysgonomonas alginatilytica]
MKLIYETDRPSKTDFNSFLNQCKRAINKLYGFNVSVNQEFWSCRVNSIYVDGEMIDGKTYWEELKETGSLSLTDGLFCIDFQFDSHVYADYSVNFYLENGLITKEEYSLFLDNI